MFGRGCHNSSDGFANFPDKEVAELGRRAKMIVVPEMNYSGQIAGEVQKALGPAKDIRGVNKFNGTIITPGAARTPTAPSVMVKATISTTQA